MLNIIVLQKSPDGVLARINLACIPEKYSDWAEVFSEEAIDLLPANENQDLLLKISHTSSFSLLYHLLRKN